MKESDKCPLCSRGFLVVNRAASYYYCNNCYKYVEDVEQNIDAGIDLGRPDTQQLPLFYGLSNEEVEEIINGLLGPKTE